MIMKKPFVAAICLLLFLGTQAQDSLKPKIKTSLQPVAMDADKETLKREAMAPDPKHFKDEAEYLKAKGAWVKSNQALYSRIIAPEKDEDKPK